MNMEPIPHITDPREADAWHVYLEETEPARQEYSARIDQASKLRDEAMAVADAQRAKARYLAWEQYGEFVTDAWRDYIRATDDARQRRHHAVMGHNPTEVLA